MYARACDAWAVLRSRAPLGSAPSGFNTVASLVCDLLEAGHITSASDAFSFSTEDDLTRTHGPSKSTLSSLSQSQKEGKSSSRNSISSSDDDFYSSRSSKQANGESNTYTGKKNIQKDSSSPPLSTSSTLNKHGGGLHGRLTESLASELSHSDAMAILRSLGFDSLSHWHLPEGVRDSYVFMPNSAVPVSSLPGSTSQQPSSSSTSPPPLRGYVDVYTGVLMPHSQLVVGPILYSPSIRADDRGPLPPDHLLLWLLNNYSGIEPIWVTGAADKPELIVDNNAIGIIMANEKSNSPPTHG
jgi:hypothetical protein